MFKRIMTGDERRAARAWFFSRGDWRWLVFAAVIYLLARMV